MSDKENPPTPSPPKESRTPTQSRSASASRSRSASRSLSIKKHPGPNDNPHRIWVGGLDDRVREHDLEDIFRKFGELKSVTIRSSRVDVFAFVEFQDADAALKATNQIDQSFIRGKRVKVHWASGKGDVRERRNDSNQIWIGQLQENDEKALKDQFSKYGKIRSLKIRSNRTDLFAFIEYDTAEACDEAVEAMNLQDFKGHQIRVAWAQDRSSKRRRSRSRSGERRRSRSYDRRRRSPSYRRSRRRSRSRERGRGVPRGDYKLEIENIPREMTWMDLKALGRTYGGRNAVTFARTWKEGRISKGLLEFSGRTAMTETYDALHGHRINGNKVYCMIDRKGRR